MESLKTLQFKDSYGISRVNPEILKKAAIYRVFAYKARLADLGLWQDDVNEKTIEALMLLGKIDAMKDFCNISEADLNVK